MSCNRSGERATVFAIYSTRRAAERAREYLDDADIEAFVQADDTGGMHPQMQRPHGGKLVGMRSAARDAHPGPTAIAAVLSGGAAIAGPAHSPINRAIPRRRMQSA